MAQIDNKFSAIWYDTTTPPWSPLLGLSATISIRRKDTEVLVVTSQAMTEIGLGEYNYIFAGMLANVPYSYVMNPNSSLAFIESWFTDPRIDNLDKNLSQINGWGFSRWNSISDFNATDRANIKSILDTVKTNIGEKEPTNFSPIFDAISAIEIPEQDNSEILRSLWVARGQLTKALWKMEKEKSDLKKEYQKKLDEKQKEIDELEDMYKELEGNTGLEIESKIWEKEKIIEELEETAKELFEWMEKEIKDAEDTVIKKIKQSL
jgi:hypothetical protein